MTSAHQAGQLFKILGSAGARPGLWSNLKFPPPEGKILQRNSQPAGLQASQAFSAQPETLGFLSLL